MYYEKCHLSSAKSALGWVVLCDDGPVFTGHSPSDLFHAHRSDQAAEPVLSLCTPSQGTPAGNTDNTSAATELSLRCKAGQPEGLCSPDWWVTPHLCPSRGFWLHGESKTQPQEVRKEGMSCPIFSLSLQINGQCSSTVRKLDFQDLLWGMWALLGHQWITLALKSSVRAFHRLMWKNNCFTKVHK